MKLIYIISNIKKKTIILFLGLSYVLTFTIFGIIFWKIANETTGEFFIFKEDININIQVSEFMKKLYIENNRELSYIVKDMINNKEYKRDVMKTNEDGFNYPFSNDGVIGENWAEYYSVIFKYRGATHFKFCTESREKILGKYYTYKIKISFYNITSNKEISSIYLYILDYPYSKGILGDNYYYPMDIYFKNIASNSISYIDDSPIVMKNVAQGKYSYSLCDFMYFSVVTITTLGYGDILPNSSLVRILVMIESVSGVIIMGAFVSCIFWNKK